MLKLYELTDELNAIALEIIEGGGELTEELEERLHKAEGEFEHKVERVALMVQQLKASAKGVKEEADRLVAKQRAFENSARSLQGYLEFELVRADRARVETELVKVGIMKNSRPSIRWGGSGPIPQPFLKVIETLDGTAAYDAWKAGEELPDGFVVELGQHVRVW